MPTSNLRYELLDLLLERSLTPDGVLRAGSLYGAWARERRESPGGCWGPGGCSCSPPRSSGLTGVATGGW
ncbi:MAG: hypothetical protein ACXVRM_08840 [Solirubrobacteraceae bacterium]